MAVGAAIGYVIGGAIFGPVGAVVCALAGGFLGYSAETLGKRLQGITTAHPDSRVRVCSWLVIAAAGVLLLYRGYKNMM